MSVSYHVQGWSDACIHQELLILGKSGVGDGPSQVSGIHIFLDPPIVLCLVDPDPLLCLKRSCRKGVALLEAGSDILTESCL